VGTRPKMTDLNHRLTRVKGGTKKNCEEPEKLAIQRGRREKTLKEGEGEGKIRIDQ